MAWIVLNACKGVGFACFCSDVIFIDFRDESFYAPAFPFLVYNRLLNVGWRKKRIRTFAFSSLQAIAFQRNGAAKAKGATDGALYCSLAKFAIIPCETDLESATSAKSGNTAF